jgi:hypothetical protein
MLLLTGPNVNKLKPSVNVQPPFFRRRIDGTALKSDLEPASPDLAPECHLRVMNTYEQ